MLFSEARWMFMCFIRYITAVEGRRLSICALKGSSVNLSCSASHAASNMSWYTVHINGSIYPTYGIAEETNFTLTINDVRESDAKLYCCKESTENPEFCSHNQTELRVAELQVKVIPATEGQKVTLMCSSSSCPLTETPAAYIWYRNGEFLYEDWSPWYQELLTGEKGVRYSCAVKGYEDLRAPEVSVDSVTETCFSVTYTKKSMCAHKPESKDQFYSITYPTDVRVQTTPGRNFNILTCNTSCPMADPHTLYQWHWNSEVYSDCEKQDITVFHRGRDFFSCAVKGNEDVHSDETCMDPKNCQAVNYASRRICALEGSSVTITSESSLMEYPWHKVRIGGGEDCEGVSSEVAGHVEYVKNNRILKINDVMRNDSAEYRILRVSGQCHLYGVMLVVTGLKVTMSPSAVVTEGQRVTLTCSTSCPLTDSTDYMWYLNGQLLTQRKDQNKHLILDPVSCNNEGNYSCAVNASQMISSTEEALTVNALEKTVGALNTLKMTLLSLIPPAVFLLYLRTRQKKTVTATAEQNDRKQPGQMDALYESVDLMATKPAT